MMRKWEWIIEKCQERGFKDSANIAYLIDQILLELYGNAHTSFWINDFFTKYGKTDVSVEEILKVVKDKKSCIACQFSKERCSICNFASVSGACNNPNSLYFMFIRKFYEESKVKPKLGGEKR